MKAKKILIVDDDTLTVKLLEKKIRSQKYEVLSAGTGQEALKKIQDESPDFILMDIMLPDLDGSEVIRRLQSNPYLSKIPVLFLSSVIANEENRIGMEVKVGGVAYEAIGKPVDMNLLLKKIKDALTAV
jgi:two-component system cell cycle response regulator